MGILSNLIGILGEGRVTQNEPLSSYTTLRLGGPAQFFYKAYSREELIAAFILASQLKISFTVLGGGSNVIISDKGISGLVVRNEAKSISIVKRLGSIKKGKMQIDKVILEVDTGVLVNQLVRYTCDEGLAGLERHLGLPGTVGGALYMNSKWTNPTTYVGDVLYQAKILSKDGSVRIVDGQYFDFGYDQSILQKTHETVVSALFLLKPDEAQKLWEKANASMEYRKQSQPMGIKSAGCTFKNISQAQALRIGTANHTTSAGYLVDQVGLKNFQIGGMKFSDKHANFMINDGTGTASEAKALIDEAKKRVKDKFNVTIEPEVVLLGEFD